MTPLQERHPHEAGAMALARVARLLDESIDAPRHAAGRERLLVAATKRWSRSATRRLLLLAAALALPIAVAVAVVVVVVRRPARLEYSVAGSVVTDGPWLGVAPSGGPLSLRFSDGTELALAPGSKGRVGEVTGNGARVVLGDGVLQAHVVHRRDARWAVAAGPYAIEVTGTAFDVGWSAASEELDLTLHDGSVVVRGPSLPDGLRVATGQRLVARASTGEAQLSSVLTAQPHEEAPVVDAPASATEAATQVHPALRPQATWSEMMADGNFRGVLDAAEARGIDSTLTRGSLADVVAFADAARYMHERSLARRGLLAERSRFAHSAEARGAAFVLGRLADDVGARDEAIRWYDIYLAESPRGSFVAEALGRKLVALAESGDAVGARAAAAEYLRRFPQGAHAAYARDHMPEP